MTESPGWSTTARSGPASDPRIRMNPHGAIDRLTQCPPDPGAAERHRQLRPADVERHHDPGAGPGLVQPGRGQVADPDGSDHPVVRRAGRVAVRAVRGYHGHVRVPGAGQVLARPVDQVGVDVDADHGARRPDDVPHQRGVVTGARADLEHPLAGSQGQLIQHDRHDGGLGRGADRLAVGVPLGHDGVVEVGVLRRQVRQEQVPRHVVQRRGDALVADPAGLQDLGDETLPQLRQRGGRRRIAHG